MASALAGQLAARGHRVHLIADEVPFSIRGALGEAPSDPPGRPRLGRIRSAVRRAVGLAERPPASGIRFHAVDGIDYPLFDERLSTLTTGSALSNLLDRERIDVVHAHYAIPFGVSALLAQLRHPEVPVVVTLHGTDVSVLGHLPSLHPMLGAALEAADAVTAVSAALADEAVATVGGVRPTVVPNFVDLDRFHPASERARRRRRRRFADDAEALLIHASNFREVKRPLDLVAILERVRRSRPTRLVLLGDGPLLEATRRDAEARGLGSHVRTLGPHPDPSRVLGLADLFLLPSATESFGLAAAEALACGTPVVASATGGLPETLGDTIAARTHAVGDVDGAAGAAVELLAAIDDPATDERRAARRHAEDRFAPSRHVDAYLEVYARAIRGRGARRRAGANGVAS